MRFAHYGRAQGFAWTSRKLSAAHGRSSREVKRNQTRYPLLADQMPAPAPLDADAEAARRDQEMRESEQRIRDFHARVWRESRRDFQQASPEQQVAIRAGWLAWTGPVTSLYYRYMVDMHLGVMQQRTDAMRARDRAARIKLLSAMQAQNTLEFA
jgi:hypothetical protein